MSKFDPLFTWKGTEVGPTLFEAYGVNVSIFLLVSSSNADVGKENAEVVHLHLWLVSRLQPVATSVVSVYRIICEVKNRFHLYQLLREVRDEWREYVMDSYFRAVNNLICIHMFWHSAFDLSQFD
jgi:hypothetical protein